MKHSKSLGSEEWHCLMYSAEKRKESVDKRFHGQGECQWVVWVVECVIEGCPVVKVWYFFMIFSNEGYLFMHF